MKEVMIHKVSIAMMIGFALMVWIVWTNPGIANDGNNNYIILMPGIPIVGFIVLSCKILSDYVKKLYIILLLIGCTALTSLVWHKFDMVPYYKGMHYYEEHIALEFFNNTQKIIKDGGSEENIINKINDMVEKNPSEVIIEKNGTLFFKKESQRGSEYQVETYYDHEMFEIDNNAYTYTHRYGNQPYLGIAWLRALTLSMVPDLLTGRISLKEYIFQKKYNRSISFWTLFFIIWMMMLFSSVLVFQNKREKEKALWDAEKSRLKARQLEELNRQMEMYKLTHLQIFDDFNKVSLLDAKQTLQNFDSRWECIIEHILGDARHDLKNKLTVVGLNDLEKDLYDKAFTPFKNTILDNLKNLPRVLDYHLSSFAIKEIIAKSRLGIPKNYLPDGSKMGIEFKILEQIDDEMINRHCVINMDRIASIINNFITNAGKAVQRKDMQSFKDNDEYFPYVELRYAKQRYNDNDYLIISVQDNGGGFPKNILTKVYKEAIERSEGTGKGQGTMYVAYFAKLMKCKLIIENRNFNKGFGACVSILIPISEV